MRTIIEPQAHLRHRWTLSVLVAPKLSQTTTVTLPFSSANSIRRRLIGSMSPRAGTPALGVWTAARSWTPLLHSRSMGGVKRRGRAVRWRWSPNESIMQSMCRLIDVFFNARPIGPSSHLNTHTPFPRTHTAHTPGALHRSKYPAQRRLLLPVRGGGRRHEQG